MTGPSRSRHVRRIENDLAAAAPKEVKQLEARRRSSRAPYYVAGGAAAAGAGVGLVALRRKKDPVKKNLVAVTVAKAAYSQDGSRPTTLTARTPSGRFVSHENDLDVFHVKPRRKTTSQLGVYRKGRGSSKAWVAKASWMTPEAIAAVKAKPAARPTLKFGWRGEPVMPHTGKFGWRGEPTRAAGFGVSKAAPTTRALPGKLEAYGRGPGRRIV